MTFLVIENVPGRQACRQKTHLTQKAFVTPIFALAGWRAIRFPVCSSTSEPSIQYPAGLTPEQTGPYSPVRLNIPRQVLGLQTSLSPRGMGDFWRLLISSGSRCWGRPQRAHREPIPVPTTLYSGQRKVDRSLLSLLSLLSLPPTQLPAPLLRPGCHVCYCRRVRGRAACKFLRRRTYGARTLTRPGIFDTDVRSFLEYSIDVHACMKGAATCCRHTSSWAAT
jgi:hypothetical protein